MPLPTLAGIVLAAMLTAGGFSYTYSHEASPKGEAHMIIKAQGDLPKLEVTIEGDGKVIKRQVPALKNGKEFKIEWLQSNARASYSVKIVGDKIEGSGQFEVVKGSGGGGSGKPGRLTPTSTREDIVDKHKVAFQVSFDVKDFEFKVFDTSGQEAHAEVGGSGKYSAGDTMEFRWPADLGVFMVELSANGEQGQTAEYRLVPWQVEIPHVDVIFDSGKDIIKPGEAPKVDKAFDAAVKELVALERINKLVNSNIQAQLYIVGYTDTVGPAGKNQALSDRRAKAIAKYFKQKGIWCEIYYAGMGERGLAVPTPDSTDEARNRRAVYLLTAQRPPAGGHIPGKWTKLADASSRPSHIKVPETTSLSSGAGSKGGAEDGASEEPEEGSGDSAEAAGDSGGGDESGSDGSGGGDWDSALEDSGDGPPEVEGEPGASKKGCQIGARPSTAPIAVLLAGLFGLSRRRRVRR
ncbi:MAG: OmpA family protein [Nannocystaceae bacterium]|nr:OmpA family protein [Myxococcales bacterium]